MKTHPFFQSFLLLSVILLILIFPSVVKSWSSMNQTGLFGSFGTHEFLCERAYDELEEHPAFEYIHFPSREKIREYSGINFAKEGRGPDNPKLSKYSEHYYNPRNGQGLAPKSIAREYKDLNYSLRARMIIGGDPKGKYKWDQWDRFMGVNAARYAAWLGHFIQDMTCAFHVNGVIKSEVDANNVPSEQKLFEITGPYSQSMNEPWAKLVERFQGDADKNCDWFDPVYWDGPDSWKFLASMGSTHFIYEGAIEWNCGYNQAAFINTMETVESYLTEDRISREWEHGMSMEDFAMKIAKNTQEKLDSDTTGYVYIDPKSIRAKVTTVDYSAAGGVSSFLGTLFAAAGTDVKVPYMEWARAIEATYTVWRKSFSALIVRKEDIKLVKVPGRKDLYAVMVRVWNKDPDCPVTDVQLEFRTKDINGESLGRGTVKLDKSITTENSSGWISSGNLRISRLDTIDEEFRIPQEIGGSIRVAIKGVYKYVPDSEMAVVQFPLSELDMEAHILRDVNEASRIEALNMLNSQSKDFDIVIQPCGPAPTHNKEDTVKSQKPVAKTLVGPREKIFLQVYGLAPVEVSGIVQVQMTEIEKDDFGGKFKVEVPKPIAGATVQVQVGNIQKTVITRADGSFDYTFTAKPDSQQKFALIQVQHENYQSKRLRLPFSHGSIWQVNLMPKQKAQVNVTIENILNWYPVGRMGWQYDVVFNAQNLGVFLQEKEVTEGGNSYTHQLSDEIYISAGQQIRIHEYTKMYNRINLNQVDEQVTYRGTDSVGRPIEISYKFPPGPTSAGASDVKDLDYLINKYIETYDGLYDRYTANDFQKLLEIEKQIKSQDNLLCIRALCQAKKQKVHVGDPRQLPNSERDMWKKRITKMIVLGQFYLHMAQASGDYKLAQRGAYILQFLSLSKRYFHSFIPTWPGEDTFKLAKRLAPQFFYIPKPKPKEPEIYIRHKDIFDGFGEKPSQREITEQKRRIEEFQKQQTWRNYNQIQDTAAQQQDLQEWMQIWGMLNKTMQSIAATSQQARGQRSSTQSQPRLPYLDKDPFAQRRKDWQAYQQKRAAEEKAKGQAPSTGGFTGTLDTEEGTGINLLMQQVLEAGGDEPGSKTKFLYPGDDGFWWIEEDDGGKVKRYSTKKRVN